MKKYTSYRQVQRLPYWKEPRTTAHLTSRYWAFIRSCKMPPMMVLRSCLVIPGRFYLWCLSFCGLSIILWRHVRLHLFSKTAYKHRGLFGFTDLFLTLLKLLNVINSFSWCLRLLIFTSNTKHKHRGLFGFTDLFLTLLKLLNVINSVIFEIILLHSLLHK
jgi:hypothetical protein